MVWVPAIVVCVRELYVSHVRAHARHHMCVQEPVPPACGGAGIGLQRGKSSGGSGAAHRGGASTHHSHALRGTSSTRTTKSGPRPPPTVAAYLRIISALVACGVPVDASDTDGASPLHLAARFGLGDVARTLVRASRDCVSLCHVVTHSRTHTHVFPKQGFHTLLRRAHCRHPPPRPPSPPPPNTGTRPRRCGLARR